MRTRTAVTLDKATLDALKKLAVEQKCSVSELLREATRAFVQSLHPCAGFNKPATPLPHINQISSAKHAENVQ